MQKIRRAFFVLILLLPTMFAGVYIYAFYPKFDLAPSAPKDGTTLFLTDSFEIEFPVAIDLSQYKNNISVYPKTSVSVLAGSGDNKLIIKPLSVWKADKKYEIRLNSGRAKNYRKIKEGSFRFKTVAYPKVVSVTPEDKSVDVRLDIEDPIIIEFDKSTEGFYIDFALEPTIPVIYQNNKEKTQFRLLPREPLQAGATYTLTIRTKVEGMGDETFVPTIKSSFVTIPPKPETWAKDLQERLVEARRFTEPQITEGKYIDINLDAQVMIMFEDGKNLGTFLISSGKPGMDTPKGRHQIYNKHPRAWSGKYGLYMPYWMAITADGRFGIHELPEWPGGYKEGQNHLGIKVSHGCVRLGVGPAEKVYNWANIGTPVIVY